jgi:CubicO group peptidase (beta-lactamase class C family)
MDERFRALTGRITDLMEELKVPGVAVGVLHEGRESVAGLGVTSVENPLEVNEHTLFQIGSITKTFTATMAMRLVEQGKLDLDAPVRTYLPDFRLKDEAVAARVTLRHVFSHRAGWEGDHFADFGLGDDAVARYVASMADLPQVLPLGYAFSYNNAGFSLAGRVIEVAAGQTFEAALSELLLEPLGMTNTFILPTDVLTRRFAVGHRVDDGRASVLRPWHIPRSAGPAGAIASCVVDMLRYSRFQLGDGVAPDGTRLLQAESLRQMHAPIAAAANEGQVGVAWMIREVGGERVLGHGGGTFGQVSLLTLVPSRGFALISVTNADPGGRITAAIEKLALERYLGLVEPEPTHRALPADEVAAYAGRYVGALSDAVLTPREGGLTAQVIPKGGFPTKDTPPSPAPPPVRLAFYGPDRVIALDPPFQDGRGDFLRDDAGRIEYFRFGGRARPRAADAGR